MYRSVYDLKGFYNSRTGRLIRRLLQRRIREFWPDVSGLRVMGCGYGVPYLRIFQEEAERVIALMHAAHGVHAWPQDGRNLVCLSEPAELPIENASFDRILLVHDLEFSGILYPALQEIWRVLKANGRLLVVVPNRSGFWARADWAPFGQGRPYSLSQICRDLHDNGFVHERSEGALFLPPFRSHTLLKSAPVFERIGNLVAPFAAGVHMVEVSKQLFARADHSGGARLRVRGRGVLAGGGAAVPQGRAFRNSDNPETEFDLSRRAL